MYAVVTTEKVCLKELDEFYYVVDDIVQFFQTRQEANYALAHYSLFKEQYLDVVRADSGDLYQGAIIKGNVK